MTAASVWSNGAWSRLWLWIMDDSCEEVQAAHGLCRHVLSRKKALPKMVPATYGKSHTYHASVYFFRAVRDPLWIKIWCVMKTQSGSPLLYIDGAAVSSPISMEHVQNACWLFAPKIWQCGRFCKLMVRVLLCGLCVFLQCKRVVDFKWQPLLSKGGSPFWRRRT